MGPFFGVGSFGDGELKEQGSSAVFEGFLLLGGLAGQYLFDYPRFPQGR